MSSTATKRLFLYCPGLVLALALVAGCPFSSSITFHNQTTQVLTPYPVKTDPPPPHREADSANNIPHFATQAIDPNGFNPVYYVSGVTDQSKANGIYIGLALDDDPMMIQYKIFHYKVPPGQAGKDPAKQPILLHQGLEEVRDVDQRIVVRNTAILPHPLPPGGWAVLVREE